MANRAADAVMSGAHKSILSYHLEDPDTKTFLQVYHIYICIYRLLFGIIITLDNNPKGLRAP
mgnify:CR=1 FL=1